MSREITSIAIEAEESETARGGFRPSSPGRQRNLQGSFEEGPSGGLSLLAEAAATFAPTQHLEPIYGIIYPQIGLGLLHSRSFHTPSGPTQPYLIPIQSRLNVLRGPGPGPARHADGAPIIPRAHVEGWGP